MNNINLLKDSLEALVMFRKEQHDVMSSSELKKLDEIIHELEDYLNSNRGVPKNTLLKYLGQVVKFLPWIQKSLEILKDYFD